MVISKITEWEMEDKDVEQLQIVFSRTVYTVWFVFVCFMFWSCWYFGAVH